jgi:hypothetical protein
VVLGVEAELDHIADVGRDLVGVEGQARLADSYGNNLGGGVGGKARQEKRRRRMEHVEWLDVQSVID